jgi:hypothetical protein
VECPKSSLGTLTGLFGYSRQSFYSHKDGNNFAENALEPLIVEKATEYRIDNPGLGCTKLYIIIKKMFEETGCMPGRDVFIEILRRNKLMVQIKRRRKYKTTDSGHQYHKYENLIKGIVPMRPNQIWVSDITYVETQEGVCYLSLITDAYSRKIVGWALGPTLETIYPLEALRMALATIDGDTASQLTHNLSSTLSDSHNHNAINGYHTDFNANHSDFDGNHSRLNALQSKKKVYLICFFNTQTS